MKRGFKVKNKIRFTVFVMSTTLILSLGLFRLGTKLADAKDLPQKSGEIYVVRSGDDLWTIAKSINKGKDIREIVYQIKKLNNISDTINPGQVLEIPE